jgi:transposase InsO family protein
LWLRATKSDEEPDGKREPAALSLHRRRVGLRGRDCGQDADSCSRFLERARTWYREQGVIVERVLTDNAKAYHSRAWIDTSSRLAIDRRYTRIYRPRTNGKAERLIQTLLREWAYARSYRSSERGARALPGYIRWYNRRRPHSALGARPPINRVSHLCGHDS